MQQQSYQLIHHFLACSRCHYLCQKQPPYLSDTLWNVCYSLNEAHAGVGHNIIEHLIDFQAIAYSNVLSGNIRIE